jgi:hypothetical protein
MHPEKNQTLCFWMLGQRMMSGWTNKRKGKDYRINEGRK